MKHYFLLVFAMLLLTPVSQATIAVQSEQSNMEELTPRQQRRMERRKARLEKKIAKWEEKAAPRGIMDNANFRLGLLLLVGSVGAGLLAGLGIVRGLFGIVAGLLALGGIIFLVWGLIEYAG